jgi:hypothetical protein
MRYEDAATLQAAFVIIQKLLLYGCEFRQDYVWKIVGGGGIGAMGWFSKCIGASSGFASGLCGVVEFNAFCSFGTDEFINARDFVQPHRQ